MDKEPHEEDEWEYMDPEEFKKEDEEWCQLVISFMSTERRMAGLKPEDRLAGLKPEDRLAGLKLEDRLAGLNLKDVLKHLKSKEKAELSRR